MTSREHDTLLQALEQRFAQHRYRHERVTWARVEERLRTSAAALRSLAAMEHSGGEPDVVTLDASSDRWVFCDCASESPGGRRSLCYDGAARDARKTNKPAGSAIEEATAMGVALLTEDEYRALQRLDAFDRKTSSWLATPPEFRALGGALFGDRRFDRVFVYHNGAESYYAARGFRGLLEV